MRTALVSAILIVVLLAAGSAMALWLVKSKEAPPHRDSAPPPPVVEVLQLEPETITERYTGYGSAEALQRATLSAEVSGVVVDVPTPAGDRQLRAGDSVSRGQPLVKLDDRQYQQEFAAAQALADADTAALRQLDTEAENIAGLIRIAERELRLASDERDRLANLFETNDAHVREFDAAKAAFEQARRVLQQYQNQEALIPDRRAQLEASRQSRLAAAELSRLDLERCTIRAPFAGTIDELFVEVGDRVGPGTPVLTLIAADQVEVAVQLPIAVCDRVEIGSTCTLTSESMADRRWTGMVARVGASANTQTRTLPLFVLVDNTAQSTPLRPGTFVTATLTGPTHTGALAIPRNLIREGEVLIARHNQALARKVEVERVLGDRALIATGLAAGDVVITAPLSVLSHGLPIRLPEARPAETPAPDRGDGPGDAEATDAGPEEAP